ncbi:hypothetical protein KTF23_08465 [Burkholderia multivorans]|uniref:hypothetical protein n=1 Tax=Burkholderia multivorans TaxID=87883 RepID=UPI001C215015|nr:hypothetical protein [Burkholderia multivorans]MBU9689880.1 hypothetical protein [Burkholderia multivorans]HEJ2440509.1 hypothetical protein [Burkholderia multivorans]
MSRLLVVSDRKQKPRSAARRSDRALRPRTGRPEHDERRRAKSTSAATRPAIFSSTASRRMAGTHAAFPKSESEKQKCFVGPGDRADYTRAFLS